MNKSLAIALVSFCGVCVNTTLLAQNISIGVSASFDYNAYWFVEEEYFIKYKGTPGFSAGLTIQRAVNAKILLKSGLYYSVKNLLEINSIDYNDPNIIEGPYESKFSSKFIDIPLDFSVLINSKEKQKTYFLIGAVNSFRVGYSSDKYASFRPERRYREYILAAKGGVSMLVDLKKNSIGIEPQIRYYFTKVHESGSTKENPICLGVEVSYVISLKKS